VQYQQSPQYPAQYPAPAQPNGYGAVPTYGGAPGQPGQPGQHPASPFAPYPARRDALGREVVGPQYGPRHLADNWEGPVNPNRTVLPSRRPHLQWLLAIPMILPLLTPIYNRRTPYLFGLPFFYWYQLGCVVVAILTSTIVYQLTKGRRPRWPR
jgi:hypothetical protein